MSASGSAPPFTAALLAPRCWPAWIGMGLGWLLGHLPLGPQLAFGTVLGRLAGYLLRSRRHVVRTNIQLCLEPADPAALEALVNAHFEAAGRGIFETAAAWFAPVGSLERRFSVEGLENLEAARADGRGILLLTGHFTTMELCARIVCTTCALPFHAMYRPYSNPVMDWCMHRLRERWTRLPALPRDDLRRLVRALRSGAAVWYGPDQTLDPTQSVFAPFFGVATSTLTATARLATMGRAQVLPYVPRSENGRYVIRFLPVWSEFPTGDEVADARRVNAVIEAGVRLAPAQYFWIHRRFKRRPPGEAKLY